MNIAVCCAMNQNRSMEAHKVLKESGYDLDSYGTNSQIKIPGETLETPNIYKFGTSYLDIYNDLIMKNREFYERLGILKMLERNMIIKEKAEYYFDKKKHHDLVITAEEKCFNAIYEASIHNIGNKQTYLVNFDIKDTINDAKMGAQEIKLFIDYVFSANGPLKQKIEYALENLYKTTNRNYLFTVIES